MTDLGRTFAALAEPTRRGVVELLRQRPRRAGDLALGLSISGPALSRHLRVLRSCGLVEEASPDDDARIRVYRLKPERFADLRRWLDEVERFWISGANGSPRPSRSRGGGGGGKAKR